MQYYYMHWSCNWYKYSFVNLVHILVNMGAVSIICMASSMLYTCIAGVAFLSWYVLKLCCHWVRSVIMCYSHVLLFNFRYSPYHYTNDFGFNTHDSDSKEVFVSCHYIWLFSSSHALKNTFIWFPCFYCINLCAICFAWYA